MQEISLHILDIVTNAIEADATRIIIYLKESQDDDSLIVRIRDNGRGMSEEMVRQVSDPFITTRSTRPVGMGISLTKQAALQAKGDFDIQSSVGKGTELYFKFRLNCLNRVPLGDMPGTMINLIIGAEDVHFCYVHVSDQGRLCFDSYWILARMAERDCSIYQVLEPAKAMINNRLQEISTII